MIASRIPVVDDIPFPSNGTTKRTTRKPAAKPAPVIRQHDKQQHVRRCLYRLTWAAILVIGTLSAALNGVANVTHAAENAAWGWALGVITPCIVLALYRVAVMSFQLGFTRPAQFSAATATCLLALSLWHCSQAIAMLTGSPLLLAALQAVGIDCGLVACEWAQARLEE